VLAPALRDRYDLSLSQIGVVLSAEWVGSLITLLPWGMLADRVGERVVLAVGLSGCAAATAGAAYAPDYRSLVLLLGLAGASGSAVNSASGRAVMGWFSAERRGLALGVRQTAIPAGGVLAALVLPLLGGVRPSFLFLAGLCLAGAVAGALALRDPVAPELETERTPWSLRDARLWRLCIASGLYLPAQISIMSFAVLFLHDARGFSTGEAAAVLAASQALAAAARIGAGRWSDRLRARIVPLRRVGVASFATVALVAVVVDAPAWLLVPLIALAGAVSMAWNGLSFTAAAELAGRARSGAAIGVQQTMLALAGVGIPVAFAAAVSASSWRAAFALAAVFPLAGVLLLGPLAER
jgi:sugar phosphate permease